MKLLDYNSMPLIITSSSKSKDNFIESTPKDLTFNKIIIT